MPAELNHSIQQLVAELTGRLTEPFGRRLRVWVGGHDLAVKQTLLTAFHDTARPPSGCIDAACVAAASAGEASYFAQKLKPRLAPSGVLLLILRQPASEPDIDFGGDSASLIDELAAFGFVPAGRDSLPESYLAFTLTV